jgi:pilus assembly protein Flp/PilA
MQSILFALLNVKARFEAMKDKERGATAVEYGLLVALIAAVIIVTVIALGENINDAFCEIVGEFGDETGDCA